MINIILFGKPGAGKGTQAEFLKGTFDLTHISTGDVFRYNIKNDTPLGLLAKGFIDKGELVPDEVTIQMLEDEVAKHPDTSGFIFDGFPRTTSQAEALDTFLTKKDMSISATLALDVAEDILVARLLSRGKIAAVLTTKTKKKSEIALKNTTIKPLHLLTITLSRGNFIL